MALAILSIIYRVIIILVLVTQVLLYRSKDNSKNNNLIFGINLLMGLILAFLVYTSLPSNFIVQKALAIIFAIIAVLAVIVKQKSRQALITSKVMLTISVIGSSILLFT